MSRERVLMLLGILVALSPFSGLPLSILSWVLPILGLAVLAIGVSNQSRALKLQRAPVVNLPPSF